MTQYLYPQNLKATAHLWLWGLRDFCILGIEALLSIVALVQLGFFIPAAATLCYGFLTIRMPLPSCSCAGSAEHLTADVHGR